MTCDLAYFQAKDRIVIPIVLKSLSYKYPNADPFFTRCTGSDAAGSVCADPEMAEFASIAQEVLSRRNCFPNPEQGALVGGKDSFEDNMSRVVNMIKEYVRRWELARCEGMTSLIAASVKQSGCPTNTTSGEAPDSFTVIRRTTDTDLSKSDSNSHMVTPSTTRSNQSNSVLNAESMIGESDSSKWTVGDRFKLTDDLDELNRLCFECELQSPDALLQLCFESQRRGGWPGIIESVEPGDKLAQVTFDSEPVGTITVVPVAAMRVLPLAQRGLVGTHWTKEDANPPEYITFEYAVLTHNGGVRAEVHHLGDSSCRVCWSDRIQTLFEGEWFVENGDRHMRLNETTLSRDLKKYTWR